MKSEINKAKIQASSKKFLADKKLISAYLRGEATKKDLDEKGIRLAMPL